MPIPKTNGQEGRGRNVNKCMQTTYQEKLYTRCRHICAIRRAQAYDLAREPLHWGDLPSLLDEGIHFNASLRHCDLSGMWEPRESGWSGKRVEVTGVSSRTRSEKHACLERVTNPKKTRPQKRMAQQQQQPQTLRSKRGATYKAVKNLSKFMRLEIF